MPVILFPGESSEVLTRLDRCPIQKTAEWDFTWEGDDGRKSCKCLHSTLLLNLLVKAKTKPGRDFVSSIIHYPIWLYSIFIRRTRC